MLTSSFPRLLLATGVVAASLTACDSTRPVASESSAESVPVSPTVDESDVSFNREVTQGDYRFTVKSYGSQEPRFISVRSYRGTAQTIDPLRVEVSGAVTNVASGDLNGNGKPELYVMTDNKRANGGLYAFEFAERGYTPITAPGTPGGNAGMGYSGQDTYQISGNKLVRTFPVTSTATATAGTTAGTTAGSTPATGTRTVEYTLDNTGKLVMGQSMDAK
ncbi:hypothetical protein MUN84_21310 [Hymenobacter sp. 5516J-16]|uniref:Lipoprotein n=1 Tax=Hymenobacter sublimis TaxID=2933777 RepID=A0ABY4JCW5_9BACT|nr:MULTISPECIES: hypothetical protein [Hymenobacter]UOQ76982.1 hypothetical protein MUN84_21310 [Hymenobacter sp. 5516J-16]UPL50663.1 hypothetical protein MWH26_07120 [Hymenobacter sublimis]